MHITVRGDLESFTVGLGKGKHAEKFNAVGGPFKNQANNDWVAHIGEESLRGSKEWVVKIEAKDNSGKNYSADSFLEFK